MVKHTSSGGSKIAPPIPTSQYSHPCLSLSHFTRVHLCEPCNTAKVRAYHLQFQVIKATVVSFLGALSCPWITWFERIFVMSISVERDPRGKEWKLLLTVMGKSLKLNRPASGKLSETTAPVDSLTTISWGILNHNYLPKLLPD